VISMGLRAADNGAWHWTDHLNGAPPIHTTVRGGKLSPPPRRVVHTTADYPTREHILGIYLPLESLASPT
jgi:hypothetical protein